MVQESSEYSEETMIIRNYFISEHESLGVGCTDLKPEFSYGYKAGIGRIKDNL